MQSLYSDFNFGCLQTSGLVRCCWSSNIASENWGKKDFFLWQQNHPFKNCKEQTKEQNGRRKSRLNTNNKKQTKKKKKKKERKKERKKEKKIFLNVKNQKSKK